MVKQDDKDSTHFKVSSLLHSGYQHSVTRYWQKMSTTLSKEALMYPIFIHDLPNQLEEITSMPGQYR
jgi:porphobilinogen synthase